jgi:ATP-dependent helicase/nuclease subunit B
LSEPEDPEREADARDWGLWIHAVLNRFHARLSLARDWKDRTEAQLHTALNECAESAKAELGLPPADALTYAAAWPRVRERYIAWLRKDESLAVAAREAGLIRNSDGIAMRGQIDRVDEMSGARWRVVDYKTARSSSVQERARDPLEEVQIAFYAALWARHTTLDDAALERIEGGYLAINDAASEKASYSPVAELADRTRQVIAGLRDDDEALRAGSALKPIGAARTCQHCEARGICRKDFWPEAA